MSSGPNFAAGGLSCEERSNTNAGARKVSAFGRSILGGYLRVQVSPVNTRSVPSLVKAIAGGDIRRSADIAILDVRPNSPSPGRTSTITDFIGVITSPRCHQFPSPTGIHSQLSALLPCLKTTPTDNLNHSGALGRHQQLPSPSVILRA